MDRIDGYLSRLAQGAAPTALVYCAVDGDRETWRLEIPDHPPLGLGDSFPDAKRAIQAWLHARQATDAG